MSEVWDSAMDDTGSDAGVDAIDAIDAIACEPSCTTVEAAHAAPSASAETETETETGVPQLGGSTLVHPDLIHVATWLASSANGSKLTLNAYRREAIRFLAWLQYHRGGLTRLHQVSGADAMAYRYFLRSPTRVSVPSVPSVPSAPSAPATRATLSSSEGGATPASSVEDGDEGGSRPGVEPRVEPRVEQRVPVEITRAFGLGSAPWKRGLQPQSIQHALGILSILYENLRRIPGENGQAIVTLNPFYAGRRSLGAGGGRPRERALSVEQWHAVMETIGSLDDEDHRIRCRWVFLLAYYSFLRAHELAKIRMGDFRRQPSGAWTIEVLGKGQVLATIAAPPVLMEELRAYRRVHGLPELPEAGDMMPAILPMRRLSKRADADHTLTPNGIYAIFKGLFARVADRYPGDKETFERASPHWMRHTGITHTLDSGRVEPRYVQKQARHANPQTTDLYDNRPVEAIAQAFAGVGAPVARHAPAGFVASVVSATVSASVAPEAPTAGVTEPAQTLQATGHPA